MTDEPDPGGVQTVSKPDELLALGSVTAEMFAVLRQWFDVPPSVTLDLAEIDSAVAELGNPRLVAAMAMRKLQALHLLATPGVRTTTDVVVTIVQDLQRALLQAPSMRLRLAAESTDWDAELASLAEPEGPGGAGGPGEGGAPRATTDADPEVERFRVLHTLLVAAVEAVLSVSEGEIRYLV